MEQKVYQKSPFILDLESGVTYYWCACGHSKNQPFCDGTHKGSSLAPVAFTPEKSGKYYLCGCKKAKTAPFCDGTHNSI